MLHPASKRNCNSYMQCSYCHTPKAEQVEEESQMTQFLEGKYLSHYLVKSADHFLAQSVALAASESATE